MCQGSKGASCVMSGEGDRSILTAVTSQDSEGEKKAQEQMCQEPHFLNVWEELT